MSWQNRLLTWALRRWIKPNSSVDEPIGVSRARSDRMPFGAKLPRGWRIRAEQSAGFEGEWIEPVAPHQPACTRCILYLHGGGYFAMSPRTHRSVTSRLAVASDARLFALDYRLAPVHPFPAALDDALAAWRALIGAGMQASRMVVAGDSAGGGLTLALLVALRDAREEGPAAGVMLSPWTDLAATGGSIVDNDELDPLFFGSWIAQAARHYLADTSAMNPLASPVYADLTGLPPLFIQVGDKEVLLDDSRRVAENAKRSGVEATIQIWADVPHGWQILAPILPEGRAALRDAAAFIRAKLA